MLLGMLLHERINPRRCRMSRIHTTFSRERIAKDAEPEYQEVEIQVDSRLVVTQIADAADVNVSISSQFSPLLRRAARAPQKVSPAAVVSRASTTKASLLISICPFFSKHPSRISNTIFIFL